MVDPNLDPIKVFVHGPGSGYESMKMVSQLRTQLGLQWTKLELDRTSSLT